jgi:hypothetical protein
VEKIEKAVKGKTAKSLQQRYQQKERTGGKIIADFLARPLALMKQLSCSCDIL